MVDEGQQHEEEDKRRREQIEARNRADQLCYQVEKALEETKDKLPADKVAVARQAVIDLRAAIDKQDHDAIARGTGELEKLMGEIATKAYEAAGEEGGPKGPTGGGGGGGRRRAGRRSRSARTTSSTPSSKRATDEAIGRAKRPSRLSLLIGRWSSSS